MKMRGYSRVILLGNLTRDPELRYTPSGAPVTSFTVAVNRNYITQSGEQKEEVSFIPVKVWGKQAESCNQYLSKGRAVFVDGRLHQRSWETEDGQRKSTIEVIGFTVQFIGGGGGEAERIGEITESEGIGREEDEVPF
jgi:single-strand DNA-binding protein